jgi:hypothetical protein
MPCGILPVDLIDFATDPGPVNPKNVVFII